MSEEIIHNWVTDKKAKNFDCIEEMEQWRRMREAPKTIYLTSIGATYGFPFRMTWCKDPIDNTDIEYIRKDVYEEQLKKIRDKKRRTNEMAEICDKCNIEMTNVFPKEEE